MGRSTITLVVITLAWMLLSGVCAELGHPGATLDDAYIHFQYARAIAEGHPMRFQAGEPITSGSTSLLWPVLLAPFYAVGFRDTAILWPAWFFGFVALGLLANETYTLTRPLAGKPAAVGAAALTLSCSGLAWCAASGMEVIPFAWVLTRAFRRASEWSERDTRPPDVAPAANPASAPSRIELVGLSWAAALFRPEGMIASAFIVATLLLGASNERRTRRDWIALGVGALAIPATPLFLWWATGDPRSLTAVVKFLPFSPYLPARRLIDAIAGNVRLLSGTLLNGEVWSAEFLPSGGAPVALTGLVATAFAGRSTRRTWRSLAVIILAAGMFIPCSYQTFLWNRLRYLWPFASGWIVGLACLAHAAGNVAEAVTPRGRWLTPALLGALVITFVTRQRETRDDIIASASAIDRQQVTLGRWVAAHLAPDARVGVNDSGAIAYFGDRKTFDIVGLTTRDEGTYWVAGPASRFEHYEKLARASRSQLPTHFFVYPEWMACDPLLGESLVEATVTDSTILGGTTMRGVVADYSLLGSGEHAWSQLGDAKLLDALDVADLECEESHRYDLADATDGEQIVGTGPAPDGTILADGGRTGRSIERFVVSLREGGATLGTVRYSTRSPVRIRVQVDDHEAASWEAFPNLWEERSFVIPPALSHGQARITLRVENGTLTTFHYWFSELDEH